MRKNSIHLRVNWGDTDRAGIVYYPNFFKWFDIAGHQFFRECGLSPSYLEAEHNIIVPLLDAQCTFENPLLYEDIVTIHTEVQEIKRKTIKLYHEIIRDNVRMGKGHEVRGWVKHSDNGIEAEFIPEQVLKILKEDRHTTDEKENPKLNA